MGRQLKPTGSFLTDFELSFMRVIWQHGPSTVYDVQACLKSQGTYAYTTVSTMLRLLERKEFLKKTAFGRRYVYREQVLKEDYQLRYLNSLLETLFENDFISLMEKLMALMEGRKFTERELQQLEEVLQALCKTSLE